MKYRIPAAVLAALLTLVGANEGRKLYVYRDLANVLTACDGITGPDVIEGKTYTNQDCDALLKARVEQYAARVGDCVGMPLSDGEWLSYTDLAYNIGPEAFCRSTLVKLRKQGDRAGACKQILRFRFVAGKDCADRRNGCYGIVKRRETEYQLCVQ